MGILVTFFDNRYPSFREMLETNYPAFREWVIDEGGWDFRNNATLEAAHNKLLEFLLEQEQLPAFDTMEQEMTDQLVYCFLGYLWVHEGKRPKLLKEIPSPTIRIDNYQNDFPVIEEHCTKEVTQLWQYLLRGRSVAVPESFFYPFSINTFRIGYWTPSECEILAAALEKLNRQHSGLNGVTAALDALQGKAALHTPGELIIMVS